MQQDSHTKNDDQLTEAETEEINDEDLEYGSVNYKVQGFDVFSLVRRLERKQILIPQSSNNETIAETDNFQRDFVWKKAQMDRFIESLILGYPTPSIFLVEQSDNRYILMDGQQRLTTIRAFYQDQIPLTEEGEFREFRLNNVTPSLKGLKYQTLEENLQLKLDNSNINAIIVQATDRNYTAIHEIFQRLNSGGTPLTPHEIRVALHRGQLIRDINVVNTNESWRKIYGRRDRRLRDHALIMRIIAMDISGDSYKNPMLSFLNNFAQINRDGNDQTNNAISRFTKVANIISKLNTAPRSESHIEAYFLGAMNAIKLGKEINESVVSTAIATIDKDTNFALYTKSRTTDTSAVKARREIAERAFLDSDQS